jgi:hypothetical protein
VKGEANPREVAAFGKAKEAVSDVRALDQALSLLHAGNDNVTLKGLADFVEGVMTKLNGVGIELDQIVKGVHLLAVGGQHRRASSDSATEQSPFAQCLRNDMIARIPPAFDFLTTVNQDVFGDRKPGQSFPQTDHFPATVPSGYEWLLLDHQQIDVRIWLSVAGRMRAKQDDGFRIDLLLDEEGHFVKQLFGDVGRLHIAKSSRDVAPLAHRHALPDLSVP